MMDLQILLFPVATYGQHLYIYIYILYYIYIYIILNDIYMYIENQHKCVFSLGHGAHASARSPSFSGDQTIQPVWVVIYIYVHLVCQ